MGWRGCPPQTRTGKSRGNSSRCHRSTSHSSCPHRCSPGSTATLTSHLNVCMQFYTSMHIYVCICIYTLPKSTHTYANGVWGGCVDFIRTHNTRRISTQRFLFPPNFLSHTHTHAHTAQKSMDTQAYSLCAAFSFQ